MSRSLEDVLSFAGVDSSAPALLHGARRLTYAELQHAIEESARRFAGLGVRAGDRVGLMLPSSPDFVAALYALWMLGCSVVPLSMRDKSHEIVRYVSGFGTRLLLTTDDIQKWLPAELERAATECRVVSLAELREASSGELPSLPRDLDAPALYQFSSGTTGISKRVERTHRNLVAETQMLVERLRLTSEDRVLAVVPLYHSYGLQDCVFAPFRVGACTVILEEFRLSDVFHLVREQRITFFPSVPYMLGVMAEADANISVDMSSLRKCLSSGAPLTKTTYERFEDRFGVAICQQYGATELGVVAVNDAPDREEGWASVGRPLTGIVCEIRDDDGALVTPGDVGEVTIRSPSQASAYFGAPEDVNAAHFKAGFFFTGDQGRLDAQGRLHVVGRKKLFIATATHKVEPAEVEEVLRAHASVAEAVVLGVPGPHGSEIVKAVVVPRGPAEVSELRKHCKERIADYKIPTVIEFRDEIPKNPLGKILRKYLMEPGTARVTEDIRVGIGRILQTMLGCGGAGPSDRFYELGGTSLAAMEISVAIKDAFGVEVPQALFFSNATIEEIATYVEERVGSEAAAREIERESPAELVETPTEIDAVPAQAARWRRRRKLAGDQRGLANVGPVMRLEGAPDVARLQAAYAALVERHEILRASFPPASEGRRMRLASGPEVRVEEIDLSSVDDETGRRRIVEEMRRPFDLAAGPLHRVVACTTGRGHWYLLMSIESILVDLWSCTLLVDDLIRFYAKGPVPGEAHASPFSDYARAFLEAEAGPVGTAHLAFWAERCRDADRVLTFPRWGGGFDLSEVRLDARDTKQVLEAQLKRSSTPFELLMSAYMAALHLETGREDILVVTPLSGRSPRFLKTVGELAQLGCVRVTVDSRMTLRNLLDRVSAEVRAGLSHAEHAMLPRSLWEGLPPDEALPLLSFQNVPTGSVDLSTLMMINGRDETAFDLHGTSLRGVKLPVSLEGATAFIPVGTVAWAIISGGVLTVALSTAQTPEAARLNRLRGTFCRALEAFGRDQDTLISSLGS